MTSGSILICTDYLPPSDGGVETVVDRLAKGLADHGWGVHILTLEYDGNYNTAGRSIEVHSFDAIDLTPFVGLQSYVSPSALLHFRSVVDDVQPDLIHVHNRFFFTSLVAACWKLTTRRRIPLVTTLHLGDMSQIEGVGGIGARAYETSIGRLIVHQSDWIIAVSNAVGQVGIRLGADPDRVSVIRNAVDADVYRPAGEKHDKSVLYVGRLIRNNGPHVLLDAVPEVLTTHPDAEIHLVGSGSMRTQLEEQIVDAGIGSSVTLHGFVDETLSYFQRASVFCRPSFSEGLPLTLLESMATETPPVVTDVAGVPEVVTHGETGFLLPPNDPSAVATALTTLLADPTYRREMGTAAREYVLTNHSWEERTELVLDVYSELTPRRWQ